MPLFDEIDTAFEELDHVDQVIEKGDITKAAFTWGQKGPVGINERWAIDKIAETKLLIFDPSENTFFRFCDGLWVKKTRPEIRELVDAFIRSQVPCNVRFPLDKVLSRRGLDNVVDRLTGHEGVVRKDAFVVRPLGILLVKNGRIEIKRSGEISFTREKGRPEDMQTDRLLFDYCPEAKATKTLEWLERIFEGRQEDVQAIGNIGGVCLYGSNLWKKLAVVWGGPNTGKTRIPELWSRLVPSRTLPIDTARLGDRFELRRMCSRILLTQPDAPRNFMSLGCANVLKQLTGYDRIRAEGKGSDEDFYLRGDKMIVFTLNFDVLVKVDVDRKAWEERLVLLHADGKGYEGEEQNPHFIDDLFSNEEEASGILNFALESIAKILKARQWLRSQQQMDRLTKVMETSDSVATWAREALRIEDKNEEKMDPVGVTVSEGWASYLRWCDIKELQPWGEQTWREMAVEAVERVYFKSTCNNLPRGGTAQKGWRGLALKV